MLFRSLFLACSLILFSSHQQSPKPVQTPQASPPKSTQQPPKTAAAPASPQSTHYPILLLGHGSDPIWSVLIGQKGPERFDRANYPSISLDPVTVNGEGTGEAWAYHAKDSATGSDVTIHLARETCEDTGTALPENLPKPPGKSSASAATSTPAKNAFRITLEHAQAGTFHGCARIAAELFPKIVNQSEDDDDDADKKKPAVTTITNFKAPTSIAFVNAADKIVVSSGALKKVIPSSGTELSLSHDGKKLLYTRNDSKMGSERTIVLYEFDSGHSRDLVRGTVRQAFWSTDDSRVAYLQSQDQKWRVLSFRANALESAAPLYNGNVDSLDGWIDGHTVLATDAAMIYWIGDDRPQQSLPLRDIYGDAFCISDSDTVRVNPINPDLLLISAKYAAPPANAPADAAGIFLYEVHAKRRVVLTPAEQVASHGEWSRDGIQIFYTRRVSATSSATFRIFWDGTGVRRYQDGTNLVIGQ
jgi:uncharacterized membrane protein